MINPSYLYYNRNAQATKTTGRKSDNVHDSCPKSKLAQETHGKSGRVCGDLHSRRTGELRSALFIALVVGYGSQTSGSHISVEVRDLQYPLCLRGEYMEYIRGWEGRVGRKLNQHKEQRRCREKYMGTCL